VSTAPHGPPCNTSDIIAGSLRAADGRCIWGKVSASCLYSTPIHSAFLTGARDLTAAGMVQSSQQVEVEREGQSTGTSVNYIALGGARSFTRIVIRNQNPNEIMTRFVRRICFVDSTHRPWPIIVALVTLCIGPNSENCQFLR